MMKKNEDVFFLSKRRKTNIFVPQLLKERRKMNLFVPKLSKNRRQTKVFVPQPSKEWRNTYVPQLSKGRGKTNLFVPKLSKERRKTKVFVPQPWWNKEKLIHSFLNYRRNEDEPKYSFLNYWWFDIATFDVKLVSPTVGMWKFRIPLRCLAQDLI